MASFIARLTDIVKNDFAKVLRYGAVASVMVPVGMALLWLFLRAGMTPVVANLCAVSLSTIPNYLLNRYWVWQKTGPNSVGREIAPFWAMAFLGLALSTVVILIADQFTDNRLVFVACQLASFGVVWVLKFFVLENFLFGDSSDPAAEPVMQ